MVECKLKPFNSQEDLLVRGLSAFRSPREEALLFCDASVVTRLVNVIRMSGLFWCPLLLVDTTNCRFVQTKISQSKFPHATSPV